MTQMDNPMNGGMKRVPAELVILALRRSGIQLRPASLRNWTRRGHITRTAAGYDLTEILAYLDRRDTPTDTPQSRSA